MNRSLLIAGAVLGFLGVALGAFGAHGLRGVLAEHGTAAVYHTATLYHLTHVPVILIVAVLTGRGANRVLSTAGWVMVAGLIVFSGSLYLLAVTGWRGLGAVTPIGGVGLLIGWVGLLIGVLRAPNAH